MIGVAVLVVTGASLAVTATVFGARQWGAYLGGNLLLAATYALLGVCLGPIFGPVGGVHRVPMPFLDIGIGQSPMLRPRPAAWAQLLPGYGARPGAPGRRPHRPLRRDRVAAARPGLSARLGVLAAWLFRHGPASPARTGLRG